MSLMSYNASEIEYLRVHGRCGNRQKHGIPLFWSGASVEFNVTGTELWFEYECIGQTNGDYMRVEIDGADMSRFMLQEGHHKICVFTRFGGEEVKNVRIYREMQASDLTILIKTIHTDGEFHPLPNRRHKIEVIGDSVTSGEGLAGARCLLHWIPAVFSCRGNYALLIAQELDADYSIVSQSGWGVYSSWDNHTDHALPLYFEQVCGVTSAPNQLRLGAGDLHDFANDPTDITIVNLGSNDAGAFANSPWVDKHGVSHKLKLDEHGIPCTEDVKRVTDAVYNFCAKIRKLRPNSIILWCHHMLSDRLSDDIAEAVTRFAAEAKDDKVYTVCLPRADEALQGARKHPGSEAHKLYADAILKKLRDIL